MISDQDYIELQSIFDLTEQKIQGLMCKTEKVPPSDKISARVRMILEEVVHIHDHQRQQLEKLRNG